MITLGDGSYHRTGYTTLTKIAHQLLTLTIHLNVLIGHQKEIMNLTFRLNVLIGHQKETMDLTFISNDLIGHLSFPKLIQVLYNPYRGNHRRQE